MSSIIYITSKPMDCEIKNYNTTPKTVNNLTSVPVLSKQITYNDFFTNFMLPNLPCVIENITENWESHNKWLQKNKPNLNYLNEKYGNCEVTIYNCNEKYFNSQKTESCKLNLFLKTWNTNNSHYLKDWHLKNTFPTDNFYQVPIFFASDWLNEYLVANNEDDYRFVYMGQTGTWTPFHVDVFNSFSWSANVCGRKRWILFPPNEENQMRDSLNNLPYDITHCYKNRKHYELIQNQGEAIFVPSGWYHQVWNLDDTISVNHNWVNGCNIMEMWFSIEENLKKVKKEIEDCRDMEDYMQHCQVVLKASFGLDFYKFYDFLKFITLKRLTQVEAKHDRQLLFHNHYLGLNHAIFDLNSLKSVLEAFQHHNDIPELFQSEVLKPQQLLEKITNCLKQIY